MVLIHGWPFFSVDGALTVTEQQRQEALALAHQADKNAALQCMTAFGNTDFRDDLAKVTVPTAPRSRWRALSRKSVRTATYFVTTCPCRASHIVCSREMASSPSLTKPDHWSSGTPSMRSRMMLSSRAVAV